jgi:hypothetical protein
MKMGSIHICLATLLLNTCAVAAGPAQGAPDSSSFMIVVPGVSVGPVRAEMTPEQVVAELGEPDRKREGILEYWSLGFSVLFRENRIHIVLCVDPSAQESPFKKAFAGHTKEGIAIKSSRADVIQAYGEPTRTETLDGKPSGEILRYRQQGLYFRLRDGKVDTIGVIFHPPQ